MKCFTALVRQWVIMCCVHRTTGPLSFMSLNMGTPSLNIYCSFYPILESKFLHLLNPCLILNANPSFKFISRCWGRRGKHEVFGEKKVPPPREWKIIYGHHCISKRWLSIIPITPRRAFIY